MVSSSILGGVIGSGKIWRTLGVESSSHGSEAVQILRPNADRLLEAGYQKARRANQALQKKGLNSSAIEELIESAYISCLTETRVELSPKQFARAQEVLDGALVQINAPSGKYSFSYQTAKLIASGRGPNGIGYRRMNRLPGRHFIDLQSDQSNSDIRDPTLMREAVSNYFMGNKTIYAAKGHNRDFHAGNCKLVRVAPATGPTQINCYDFGAFEIRTIEDDEIKVFSQILMDSIFDGEPYVTSAEGLLIYLAQAQRDGGKDLRFTTSAFVGMMALSDYEQEFGWNIRAPVLACGMQYAHPLVQQAFENRLGRQNLKLTDNQSGRIKLFEEHYEKPHKSRFITMEKAKIHGTAVT